MITAEEACHLTEAACTFNEEEFQRVLEDLSRSIRCYAAQGKKSVVFLAKRLYADKLRDRLNIPGSTAIFTVDNIDKSWPSDEQQFTEVRVSWHRI